MFFVHGRSYLLGDSMNTWLALAALGSFITGLSHRHLRQASHEDTAFFCRSVRLLGCGLILLALGVIFENISPSPYFRLTGFAALPLISFGSAFSVLPLTRIIRWRPSDSKSAAITSD